MTLGEAFEYASDNPETVIFYFAIIPFAALLAGWMEKEEGHLPPWNYMYSAILYMVAIPGILAVALSAYIFLFQKGNIMEANLLLQVLPVASMLLTFAIVKNNVRIESLPGFDKLSSLVLMVAATLALMWFIDKVKIIVFSYMSIQYLLLIFIGLLIAIRYGWRSVTR